MSRLLHIAIIAAGTLPLAAQQHTANPGAIATKVVAGKARQDALTTIQGNAIDAANRRMRNVLVRLRDARFGRIVDTQQTDASGLFAFNDIDPGSYVVEMLAGDQSVVAASQLLNAEAGEVVTAVVKLPFKIPLMARGGRGANSSSAAALAAQAAASGVAAVVPTSPVSPNQ